MRIFGFSPNNINLILLDGHSQGALDNPWLRLFPLSDSFLQAFDQPLSDGELPFITRLKPHVCFHRAAFVSAGYDSPLSLTYMTRHPCQSSDIHLKDFVHFFLGSYGIDSQRTWDEKDGSDDFRMVNVGLILRKDYMAHPRLGFRHSFIYLFIYLFFI
jgi:hypothetical protein